MHRFYLPDAPDSDNFECALGAEESQHAGRVLRLRAGDEVECFDGRGNAWRCEIAFSGQTAIVRAMEQMPSNESPIRVTLYQGLPKLDKFDLITQKATELGAYRIVPVNMARSVAKAEGKDAQKKRDRWLEDMRARELMLMPYELHRGRGLNSIEPGARDIGILIGPEGGIDAAEAEKAETAGALPVTLGPRILRTETAAIATIAMTMLRFGDTGGDI